MFLAVSATGKKPLILFFLLAQYGLYSDWFGDVKPMSSRKGGLR